MRVRFRNWVCRCVLVPMMLVVSMGMLVCLFNMTMIVFVSLDEMKIESRHHQRSSDC